MMAKLIEIINQTEFSEISLQSYYQKILHLKTCTCTISISPTTTKEILMKCPDGPNLTI